jgi:hypothetical protein
LPGGIKVQAKAAAHGPQPQDRRLPVFLLLGPQGTIIAKFTRIELSPDTPRLKKDEQEVGFVKLDGYRIGGSPDGILPSDKGLLEVMCQLESSYHPTMMMEGASIHVIAILD